MWIHASIYIVHASIWLIMHLFIYPFCNLCILEKPLVKIYSTISPPDINVSIIPQNMSHDLVLPVDNVISQMNITFQCLPNKEGLNYTWFFRGMPISSQESQFLLSGPNLTIFVTKLDNVLGTVQCFAENLAGRGTFSVRILKGIVLLKVSPTILVMFSIMYCFFPRFT